MGTKFQSCHKRIFLRQNKCSAKAGERKKQRTEANSKPKQRIKKRTKRKTMNPKLRKMLPKDQTKTTSAEKPNPTRDQPTKQPAKPISLNDQNKEENPSKKKDKEKEESPNNLTNMGKPKENPTNTNNESKQEEKSKQPTKHRDEHEDEKESNKEITNNRVSPVVGRGRKRRESSDKDELPPTPSVSPRNSPKDDYPAPESKYFASAKDSVWIQPAKKSRCEDGESKLKQTRQHRERRTSGEDETTTPVTEDSRRVYVSEKTSDSPWAIFNSSLDSSEEEED